MHSSFWVSWSGIMLAVLAVASIIGIICYQALDRCYMRYTADLAAQYVKLLLGKGVSKAIRQQEADALCAELCKHESPFFAYYTLLRYYRQAEKLQYHAKTGEPCFTYPNSI